MHPDSTTPDCSTCDDVTMRASLLLIVDKIRTSSPDHLGVLSGWQWESLRGKLLKAGFSPDAVTLIRLDEYDGSSPQYNHRTIVGLGEETLRYFTDKRGIDKWVLSPLRTRDGRNFIASYDLGRLQKQYELNLYFDLVLRRAHELSLSPNPPPTERFLLNPDLEETLAILESIKDKADIAVDVETGYGQINTVGFAWSPSDAIAINVLPDRFADHSYFELWRGIQAVLESPGRKILQNFIYDLSYFSAYGIQTRGEIFDTMWAMKFLWPELKSNLGNVGRIYTKRPYWKDDGKVTDEEGQKKDWGNVRDWTKHYQYNCRDTTGTFEASQSQRSDLLERRLDKFFHGYTLRLVEPIREMCANGMPLCLETRSRLTEETEAKLSSLKAEFQAKVGRELNPNSSRQIITWLKEQGIKVPKIFNKDTGNYSESADAKSIKTVRMKHPKLEGLVELQQIKTLSKALSLYINFDVRSDGKLSYSLNGCGTETLRFSSTSDPWDKGFGPLTIPREGGAVSIKSMFVAPPGYTFIEADLKAAETYYVAFASVCKKMMDMLRDGEDIHKYVAHAILRALNKPNTDYTKLWRNLGKKTGHGANYLMKEGTFVDNVFKDMDMTLSKKEGKIMLDSYFEEFTEVRLWHGQIDRELYTKRKLTAPSGWERYFYGRPGRDMLREAVPWAPQHTVPWIINHMMFYLMEERKRGNLEFQLLTQVHDALYLLVPDAYVSRVGLACLNTKAWHPRVVLPGGELIIPVEVEIAKCLANKESFHG